MNTGRQRWAKTGSTLIPSDLDDDAKRRLIPRFAATVAAMLANGWIELWQGNPTPMSIPVPSNEADVVLADPATWIKRIDGNCASSG